MANTGVTVTGVPGFPGQKILASWTFAGNFTGTAFEVPGMSDRCVQMKGTWDSASISLKGSNDGTNFEILRDPAGNSLTFTADGLKQVLENPRYLSPVSSSAGANANVTVTVFSVRS